jgi:hypothetical protein
MELETALARVNLLTSSSFTDLFTFFEGQKVTHYFDGKTGALLRNNDKL